MSRRGRLVRGGLVGALLLPASLVLGYGCSDVPEYDSVCGWVADPDNCYREFFRDVGTRCGSLTPKQGYFLSREQLDVCVLVEGGQVIFDPPIELDKLPPEQVGFKFINVDATECGKALFFSKYSFSLTINPDPEPEEGPVPDELVQGGTFSMTGGTDTDTLEVSCPGGSFIFDRLEITKCPEYEEILPHAELDINAGGIDQNGVAGLRVYFPPQEGELANAAPVPVEYVQCIIPAAPPLCENLTRDGLETDIDCGGPQCNACGDSQACTTPGDCVSGVCELKNGIRSCTGP